MINFIRYKLVFFFLSFLVLGISAFALITWGLQPSVDFTGGTLLQIDTAGQLTRNDLETFLQDKDLKSLSIQESEKNSFLIRTSPLPEQVVADLQQHLEKTASSSAITREETVGPTLGRELLVKTVVAIILASISIVVYTALQFKSFKYGLCAVLAMFHDSGILLGSFAILGHFYQVEVDVLFVTAVLTTLSFSVHDTIVVYDRVRELSKKHAKTPYPQVVNLAINQTLVRSLNNSFTIIFMLLALALLGGETIKWFVVALLIGTIAGTYSSTFTAAPLLVVWEKLVARRK
jgi:preprotein translocase subunit SecF